MGTTIEWYDFFLYGFAASLVLGRTFFPPDSPFAGTLAAFATYFGGFAARPVGAAIFGHFGDRIGRKATLVATLLLMGTATCAVGLVPTYAQVGLFGAAALTILRVVQGIGVGGEWGGSVLLAIEWGSRRRRGFFGSWPQVGVPAGLVTSYGALHLSTLWLGAGSYWGWRIPFLLSALLIVLGLYVRLGVLDTPAFTRLLEERRVVRAPLAEVWRAARVEVLLCCLLRTGVQAPFYIFTTFILLYAVRALGFAQSTILMYTLAAAGVSLFTVLLWGHLSDVVGRRAMYMAGAAAMLVWSYPYWALVDAGRPELVLAAVLLSLPIHDMQYGPQAALIAESFTARVRYTGASLGYHLASVIAGGPAPIVALWLYTQYRSSLPIALYMMACAAVSLVAAALLRERSGLDMAGEYDRSFVPLEAVRRA